MVTTKRQLFICLFSVVAGTISAQNLALKSNLAADATTTINVAGEIGIKPKTTLDIYANYNPWSLGDNKQFKHFMIQPEYRYWFCERFSGHFLGVHAHAGVFNIGGVTLPFGMYKKLRDYRYEGEFVGAGISWGYQWVMSRNWNLELNLGVGYAHIWYDRYKCKTCGKQDEKDKQKDYLGPTKAALSLVYLF